MKNTLTDLNNYLFASLESINDDSLDDAALDREIKRADATVKIADKIIQNGNLALRTAELLNKYGVTAQEAGLAVMLEVKA